MNLNSPTSVTAPAEPETSQPEHTMPSSSSEQIAMILERMKVLAAEQVSLSETIRKSLDQSEAQRQASKDANKIMTDVKSSLTEVKKINDQGFSELTRQYSEKLERIEKKMSEIMATMLELTIKISNLKVLTVWDRVKQYALQVLITIGIIAVPVGIYEIVRLIVSWTAK